MGMAKEFQYNVFLNHSARDKAMVRPLVERLQQDGRHPKAECRRQKDELHRSALSLQHFSGAPLKQQRRFIPLWLEDASCSARMMKQNEIFAAMDRENT